MVDRIRNVTQRSQYLIQGRIDWHLWAPFCLGLFSVYVAKTDLYAGQGPTIKV